MERARKVGDTTAFIPKANENHWMEESQQQATTILVHGRKKGLYTSHEDKETEEQVHVPTHVRCSPQ